MSFFPDITPLIKEIQEFKTSQQKQQAQIIALLEEIQSILLAFSQKDKEQNQLLKEILKK